MTTSPDKISALLERYPLSERFLVHGGHGLYGPLSDCALPGHTLLLETDECHKSMDTVARIWDFLLAGGASRRSLLIAVGGGVLTDMAGFAAATWMRGMEWVSVPTTLLSMVDAGQGGKTGFNYAGVKNLIGAFHTPIEVYLDERWLDTLDGRQILSGYAEMVKHSLIDTSADGRAPLPDPFALTMDDILASIAIKERIVALDPHEQGLRKALNFGHTVGHALEALSLSGGSEAPLLHGYAVMYGLVAELYLSHVLLGLDRSVVSRAAHLVTEYYGRPNLSCRRYPELLSLMRHDKKGAFCFTLLRHVGEPVVDIAVDERQILESLDYLFSI